MPLPVTEDTPPDMLAGKMDIKVLLPNGRTINLSVERSTPMMDLLVQLTTAHKLSLAAHMLVALSDSGAHLHHLPSTPVGALDTRLLHVTQRNSASLKRPVQRPNHVQPFQTTFRLQVHLPRNQLFVSRVSPDTCLEDVLNLACAEKNLDPAKYELRHPANLQEKLLLSHTLGDYRLQEVTLVASRAPGAPMTPADIMALQKEEEKRRQQVKATGSAYGIAFNKRSRANVHQSTGSVSSDSLNGRSISPAPSDESAGRSISPPAPLPPTRPARKRRPAPKPPAPGTELIHPPTHSRTQDVLQEDSMTYHSRTSSDSSGYHEASVLSETTDSRTNGGSPADTLPRRSKLPSSNHIAAKQHKSSTLQHGSTNQLSRSLSNLTSASNMSNQNGHSSSTTSLASQGHLPRKKKAAPPPPVAPARRAVPVDRRRSNPNDEIDVIVEVPFDIPIATKTIVEEDISIPESSISITKLNASNHTPAAPKLDKKHSTASLNRDSQSNIIPPKEAIVPSKAIVIPPTEDIAPPKKPVAPPKEDVVPVVLKITSEEPAATPLPKPVPVDAASKTPVPTLHPSVTEELMTTVPQPKPRVLAKPKPQPRQTRAPPSAEPSISMANQDTETNLEKETSLHTPRVVKVELKRDSLLNLDDAPTAKKNPEHKNRGQLFGVGKTMLALSSSDEGSVRSSSVRSNDSRSTDSEASARLSAADFDVLDNDVDMFAMPERKVMPEPALVFGSANTGRFSDLDFETSSLSSSGSDETKRLSVPKKKFLKASSDANVKHKMADTNSVKSLTELDEKEVPGFLAGGKSNMGRWPNVELLSEKPEWQLGEQETVLSDDSSDFDSGLKGNHSEQRNTSPELESSDWEYHLPAPPSAFRDLSSPTTTEFGTVMLSDTQVFHEPQSLTSMPFVAPQDEVDRRKDEVSKRQDEVDKRKDEVDKRKDEASKRQDEVDKRKDEASKRQDEDDKRKDEASKRKDEDDKRKDEDDKRKDEASKRQDEVDKRKDEVSKRHDEDDSKRHEEVDKRKDVHNVGGFADTERGFEADLRHGDGDKSSPKTSKSRHDKQGDLKVTVVVERRSETKQMFSDEIENSWEPQQLGVENKVSSQGGKLINGDVRLRPGGVTKEVFKVNPIFDAQQFEDAGKSKAASGKYAPDEREIIEKSKTLISRTSSADLQSSNTLKNFTISAYEKPKFVDTIFREESDQNSDTLFKKPAAPTAKPVPVVRTNSYTSNDTSRPSVVKRSTSYISLARPYMKPSSFQSINRTKSISNLVLEEDSVGSELRKSTSEANMSRIMLDEEPPLHSLEVLRSILPQLSRSQTALHEEGRQGEPMAEQEIKAAYQPQPVDTIRTTSREIATNHTTEISNSDRQTAVTLTGQSEIVPQLKEVATNNPEPKPYVYLGPPAINFGSWSERPKVQVSLKSDKDYRIGRHTTDLGAKPATTTTQVHVNSFRNIAIEKVSTTNNNVDHATKKIEPTPLTMRIVSHTTHGASRRNDASRNHNNSSHSEYNDQEKTTVQQGFNDFKSDNVSRLPIVRAVELKKTANEHFVPLRNMSSTHLNGGMNTSNVSKISVNNYQGSNSINRHSYIDGDNGHHAFANLGSTKSVSTSQLNVDALNQSNKFVNANKKYTSVVGINGSGNETAAAPLSTKPAVHTRPNFNTIKVGAGSGPKPMPTVKGFRLMGDESASNATREEQTMKRDAAISSDNTTEHVFKSQPLKTINGVDHARAPPNWVQRSSAIVNSKAATQVPEQINVPTTIKFKKPIQRPLEKRFTNPRDALMDAIKNFGGEDALKLKNKDID